MTIIFLAGDKRLFVFKSGEHHFAKVNQKSKMDKSTYFDWYRDNDLPSLIQSNGTKIWHNEDGRNYYKSKEKRKLSL